MNEAPAYCEVSPDDVQNRLERGDTLRLIDVRQAWEYENYHIPGADLIPLGELPARYAAEIALTETIVCICEHGVRSRSSASFLAQQGYRAVSTMTGGMAEYHGQVDHGPAETLTPESHS